MAFMLGRRTTDSRTELLLVRAGSACEPTDCSVLRGKGRFAGWREQRPENGFGRFPDAQVFLSNPHFLIDGAERPLSCREAPVLRASSSSPFDEMKDFLKFARCARPMERTRIFFPTAALLVGHESRFAPSSRLAFGKNLARERQRSFRAGHWESFRGSRFR
jgi:hypothetical protein